MGALSQPHVIVTRPAGQAQPWLQGLRALGLQADAFALLDIAPLPDPAALQPVCALWPSLDAVMFVSANAVHYFMQQTHVQPRPGQQAWATGPGTVAALLKAGWPGQDIVSPPAGSERWDSEALWTLAGPGVRAGQCVLIVRGADEQTQIQGRDWLAHQLQAAGAQVHACAAYVRQAPRHSALQWAQARQWFQAGSWWLFSSSQAARELAKACPDWPWAQGRALATHPRIAAQVAELGWGRVQLMPAELSQWGDSIECLT
ncbi:MAG: Uroporphyrinogen-III synthase [Pseudomonadota bacterium]|jgi:uroporphyrinogen-III synthase